MSRCQGCEKCRPYWTRFGALPAVTTIFIAEGKTYASASRSMARRCVRNEDGSYQISTGHCATFSDSDLVKIVTTGSESCDGPLPLLRVCGRRACLSFAQPGREFCRDCIAEVEAKIDQTLTVALGEFQRTAAWMCMGTSPFCQSLYTGAWNGGLCPGCERAKREGPIRLSIIITPDPTTRKG